MQKFEYEFLPALERLPESLAQEYRIRTALGMTRGPLPKVNSEWLRKYHEHLSSILVFPFYARYTEELSSNRDPRVTSIEVFGLVNPIEIPNIENTALLCRVMRGVREEEIPLVDLEVEQDHPNFQLLEDYWYWIWNWRFDPQI